MIRKKLQIKTLVFMLMLFVALISIFSIKTEANAAATLPLLRQIASSYSKPSDEVLYAPYVDVVGDSSESRSESVLNDDLIIFILIAGGVGIGIFMIGCGISSASTSISTDDHSEKGRKL